MLIRLFEEAINKDGRRIEGRPVGEILCKGDGTPGVFTYFETCNAILDVNDVNHLIYGKQLKILDESDRMLLIRLFEKPLPVTEGVVPKGIYHIEGRTLKSWHRETIEYIVKYKIPAWFGTISGKIVD